MALVNPNTVTAVGSLVYAGISFCMPTGLNSLVTLADSIAAVFFTTHTHTLRDFRQQTVYCHRTELLDNDHDMQTALQKMKDYLKTKDHPSEAALTHEQIHNLPFLAREHKLNPKQIDEFHKFRASYLSRENTLYSQCIPEVHREEFNKETANSQSSWLTTAFGISACITAINSHLQRPVKAVVNALCGRCVRKVDPTRDD